MLAWADDFDACAQGAAVGQPHITAAEAPITAAEAPCSDQQALYLLASASFAVFVWADGFDTCVPGAAITQPLITAAELPNNGAKAPCNDQQVFCLQASISFAVYV